MKPPFKTIPELVCNGVVRLDRLFIKGNQAIREHHAVAFQCLEECLEDFRCDGLLMLALTLSSSSVTTQVKSGTQQFEAGPRKEPAMFVANLLTTLGGHWV